jgi:hypothetical protein
VSDRGPVVRALVVLATVVGGGLALAGGLALRGPGLVAVCVGGLFAACLCAAIAHEEHGGNVRASLAAGAQAAAWTVAVLLAVAGTAGLAGGVIAALLAGTAVMGGAAYWVVRSARADRAAGASGKAVPPSARGVAELRPAELLSPVPQLSTRALGQEWLRTSTLLAGRLDPAVRAALVGRRQEVLDELELRDPDGFGRWLGRGPVPGSDPADYVQRDRTAGTDAA